MSFIIYMFLKYDFCLLYSFQGQEITNTAFCYPALFVSDLKYFKVNISFVTNLHDFSNKPYPNLSNQGGAGADAGEDGKVPAAEEAAPAAVVKLDNANFEDEVKEGIVFVKVGIARTR